MKWDDGLPVAYGVILGSGVGWVAFAVTNEILWLTFAIGIGVVLGAIFTLARANPKTGKNEKASQ